MDKEEMKIETIVMEQLPQVSQRVAESEDKKGTYNLITRDEALTEILNLVRAIKKVVA